MKIQFANEWFDLLPDGALYWERRSALLVADLHLGKSASFRAAGMPIPRGITAGDLERLGQLVHTHQAKTVWFLGDLFHARESQSDEIQADLARWRDRHANLELCLVRGNHDLAAGDPAKKLRFEIFQDPYQLGSLQLAHTPRVRIELGENDSGGSSAENWHIAGHLHPCVFLKDRHRSGMRLPCFFLRGQQLVLPAFGTFTGGHSVKALAGDRVFVGAEGEVIELPTRALQRVRRSANSGRSLA